MNQTITLILFVLVAVGIVWLIYRSLQREINRVIKGERSLADKDIWLKNAKALPARVLSRKETIKPEANGIAKVELELEIQMPDEIQVKVVTSWLVEIPSLPLLKVGDTVEVKFDPKAPQRVFPAVPWARMWLFGK